MLTIATTRRTEHVEREVYPIIRGLCRESVQLLAQAFREDPLVFAIFAGLSGDERVKRLMVAFAAELSVCVRRGYPLCVRDNDRIAAAAIIHYPQTYPLSRLEQVKLLSKMVRDAGSYGLGRWLVYQSEVEKYHPKQGHYYLELIGVKPGLQGIGFGSTILKEMIRKANEDRVGCYLETSNPRNVPLYERFGFQVMREKVIIGVNTWFMWRSPGELQMDSDQACRKVKIPQPKPVVCAGNAEGKPHRSV